MGKQIEKYGILFEEGTPLLRVELAAYALNRTTSQGGLGAEQHFKNAFRIMWPKYEWSDWVEMLVWAWCNNKYISVIGHQSASKTYTTAHIGYLDYCAAPTETSTSIATVTLKGLRERMWGDMLMAMSTAVVPCPFHVVNTSNEMSVYVKDKAHPELEKFRISGIVVDNSKESEGKIRGAHTPRKRFIGDESQDMAPVIYGAMTNIMSNPDGKVVLLTNPKHKISPFGNFCEPVGGWGSVNETDLYWNTKKGGICIHFDGLQSPNVKANKTIFTGLLTKELVEETRRVDGENSVAWWSRIRGFFPPDGMISNIFNSQSIMKARPDIVFDYAPEGCASLDPAYEQDKAVMHIGELGKTRSGKFAINCRETLVMNYKVGMDQLPKHYQLALWVKEQCQKRNIPAKNFIMDRTGNGSGTHDILRVEWSTDVQAIEYGGAATDRLIRTDAQQKANEKYQKFVTELWFRGMNCCYDGLIGGLGNLHEHTERDLNSREYEEKETSDGTKLVAESKREVIKRLGCSPDYGDAFCQFGELLCRLGEKPGSGKPAASKSAMHQRQLERARKASAVYSTEDYSH